jgi:hypothetical protein
MSDRPSSAPIALLLTAGVLCLGATFALPASKTTIDYSEKVVDGVTTVQPIVSSTADPVWPIVAYLLLGLAVAAFAGAGWLAFRRGRKG